MNISSTYLKRSAGPGNAGMLVNLQMGKNRIVDVGKAIAMSDAPNKMQVDAIATVNTTFKTPNMTSNTTPVPFATNALSASDIAWKAFSTIAEYSVPTTETISLSIAFGAVRAINFVELTLSDIVDEFRLLDQNDQVLFSRSLVNGSLLFKFGDSYTASVTIEIVQLNRVNVSNIVIGYNIVQCESPFLVKTTGMNVEEAVNISYMNNALLPLTSSIVPTYVNPPLTSDITPAPYAAYSSVIPLHGYEAYKAFDFDIRTNYKVVAPASKQVRLTLEIPNMQPTTVRAFEIAGANDDITITTTNFRVNGVQQNGLPVVLYESNTPLPQGPTAYSVQSSLQFTAFELEITARENGSIIGVNMFNIFANAISFGGRRIIDIQNGINGTDAANILNVQEAVATRLELAGGTMDGDINMNDSRIYGLPNAAFARGDAMSRQSILQQILPTANLGSVLGMSLGAILANLDPTQIIGVTPVILTFEGSPDLTPNPSGNYFAFNSDRTIIDVIAGSYSVCLNLLFANASPTNTSLIITIEKNNGDALATVTEQVVSCLLVQKSLQFTLSNEESVRLKVEHTGTSITLISGVWGIYRTTNQSRAMIIHATNNTVVPITTVASVIPLVLGPRVPIDVIAPNMSISNNIVNISFFTGLVFVRVAADIANDTNNEVDFSAQLSVNCGGVLNNYNFGPYAVARRSANNALSIRSIGFETYLRCASSAFSITLIGQCTATATVRNLSVFVSGLLL
jgi:hypothetical protein